MEHVASGAGAPHDDQAPPRPVEVDLLRLLRAATGGGGHSGQCHSPRVQERQEIQPTAAG